MIKEILDDLRELRDEMVQKNWPAQRLSNIILKYETKQPKETMAVHDETYDPSGMPKDFTDKFHTDEGEGI